MYRIGQGFDIHRLVKGRNLILGGVDIPYDMGLLGHSDGDALSHAICDALLGALGLGDIGEHYPDTDPKYKGISSLLILEDINKLLKKEQYTICNIDSTIIAEKPKLSLYKGKMREKIASIFKIPDRDVNIKAKTHESIGEIGRKEAISVHAVILLRTTKS